jgi:hypothetical protein
MPDDSPNASTFDLAPPRRPGVTDFNNASKEDDPDFPPNPVTMPTAGEYNTLCKLMVAMGKVMPVAIVDIKFTTGTPSVDRFVAASSSASLSSFTVVDSGAGVTDVHWDDELLPPPAADPEATITEDVEIDRIRTMVMPSAPAGRVGVRVKTKLGATGTDARFQLKIY